MQRFKKSIVWLSLFSLIMGLFPVGLISTVEAAAPPSTWTPPAYFIPNDIVLQRSNAIILNNPDANPASNTILSRTTAQVSTKGNFPVEGIFTQVSTNLQVTVQQLNSNAGKWEVNANSIVTDKLTDNGSSRFSANLKLFSGYNKITFSGTQSNIKKSDTFYVLYDRVPTLVKAQVLGSGSDAINLNEGTKAVVASNRIMIKGTVENATKVSIAVGNEEGQSGTLLDTGEFFSSYLYLSPGLNTLTIQVENETSKMKATRLIYFFDENQPFVELKLENDGYTDPIDLLTSTPPTVAKGSAKGGLTGKVLLPYKSYPFTKDIGLSLKVNDGATLAMANTVTDETVPGPDGVTPAYHLVTFTTTDTFDFSSAELQKIEVMVAYGTDVSSQYKASKKASFKYLPGQNVIKNMYLLEGYEADPLTYDFAAKKPLNNTQVNSSEFYILVEGEGAIAANTVLDGKYLPLSTNGLTIDYVTTPAGKIAANQAIYKVTGFSSGNQQVRFNFNGSLAFFNANISYVSRSKIHVDNLINGQTITINSATSGQSIKISGQYSGFGNKLTEPHNFYNQVTVNGVEKFAGNAGPWLTPTTGAFSLDFTVSNDGPLYYGQNTIVLSGKTSAVDPTGTQPTEILETIRFFIIDENKSKIEKFIPVAAPSIGTDRYPFAAGSATNSSDLNKIFEQASDFTPSTEGFVTGRNSYDLVIHGGGADKIELYKGTESFFNMDISATATTIIAGSGGEKNNLIYDFSGTQENFILRIRDLKFDKDVSSSHVYNMDLINRTGSRTSQKLEVKREVSAFRIVAPQPTVGEDIIVNRNFVRFDIEAEGATSVTIGKEQAVKRKDINGDTPSRFILDYVGLKKDAWNTIKIQIDRSGVKSSTQVRVFYTGSVAIDSQYMAEKVSTKYSVFNKQLELSFPKGTLLQSAIVPKNSVVKFYPDNKLLFGIADPLDGVVERRNDYGNIIFDPLSGEDSGYRKIGKPDYEVSMFTMNANTFNFTKVSDIYWISGGIGENGNSPSSNGLPPYSSWYSFPSTSNQSVSFMGVDATRKLVPSQRGELKLSFDPNIVDAAGTSVTVFRLTDGGVWENIGGEVDTKKGTITVAFDQFGYYKVMKLKSSYKDITNHGWAREILNALYSKGIMMNNGLRSDAFGTDDPIKRGEFATLLVKGLNLPLNYDDEQTFFDVVPAAKTNTWSYAYIETAARAGIVTGLGEGYFGVIEDLSREQAAVMVARALKLKLGTNDSKLEATLAKAFLDSSKIDVYARTSVQAVYSAKIMSGVPVIVTGQKKPSYNFNPQSPISRAEAGKIVVELLKKSTNIFPKNLS
ncbi:S-layer homology domain-containing protein [Paenibacillus antarcticus]|uniref:SLH domain-containing protein n=1 Tax=Paenibacillus antarcticus TaxID=253703 RepID=A0A168QE91_9BACL|nr:S-layer homology domain-containing protein [Paenibacillus antarcticus]OAB47690.1 hypothetical protein PBAT_05665 [Paenibacillus antarcticus]